MKSYNTSAPRKLQNIVFGVIIGLLSLLTLLALIFVIYFILHEAIPTFRAVPLKEFLFSSRWMPIDFTGSTGFGIFNFIIGTLFVSALAMLLAFLLSLGTAIFLACVASDRARSLLYPFIDLLAGIPSVVYGFIGLTVLVKFMLKAGVHTGSCVLAAAILLAVMLLPYMTSSFSETILKSKRRYLGTAQALGVDKWYAVNTVILPDSAKNIWTAMILAIGRAMGETMAVMMVMGNANLFPTLLNKGETIASLIALEMGTAEVGSTHYHALYAAGAVLMILLFIINICINRIRARLNRT